MKIVNTALFRALIAIVAGGLMIQYREKMVTWLTVGIGVMFFLSGVVSIIAYYVSKNNADKAVREAELSAAPEAEVAVITKPTFPIVGLGSIILGVILFFMPATFVRYLVYIFAAIIILGAIGQYVSLISIQNAIKHYKTVLKSQGFSSEDSPEIPHCGFIYWVIPTILLLFGIYSILDPIAIASAPFLFIGIAMIFYGVAELINAIKFYSVRKTIARGTEEPEDMEAIEDKGDEITDAEIVEEKPEEDTSVEEDTPEEVVAQEAEDKDEEEPAEDNSDEEKEVE